MSRQPGRYGFRSEQSNVFNFNVSPEEVEQRVLVSPVEEGDAVEEAVVVLLLLQGEAGAVAADDVQSAMGGGRSEAGVEPSVESEAGLEIQVSPAPH